MLFFSIVPKNCTVADSHSLIVFVGVYCLNHGSDSQSKSTASTSFGVGLYTAILLRSVNFYLFTFCLFVCLLEKDFNPGLTRYAMVSLLGRKLTISQAVNFVGEERHEKSLISSAFSKAN